MRKYVFLFLLIVATVNIAKAQINNALLESNIDLNDSMRESVCLLVDNNTFFKNNEYFHKITTGYTLFGTQLKTALAYIVNPHVRIQAGIYARKDFGNEKLTAVAPLLSIKIQKNGYSVIMGNLEGNVSHRLAEPIYNDERVILNNLENGLQIKIDRKKIWADTWMNWEVQQYLHSTYQEQFSAGHSSKIVLYANDKKGFECRLPLQLLVSHKGGQLDIDTTPLKTIANMGTGLVVEFKNPDEHKFLKCLSANYLYTYFNNLSPTKTLSYKQGNGSYVNVNAVSKYDIGTSVGYWSGKEYISSRGGDLFQSVASIYGKQGYTEQDRSLLFFRFFYQHKVFDAVNVDVRFEPYLDLNNQFFEYNYSVYFTYKKEFTLVKLKK